MGGAELEKKVVAALADGWELVGGVAVVQHGSTLHYFQAVTRKPK